MAARRRRASAASKSAGPPPWAEVALSVYELHGTSSLSGLTRLAGLGGAYHVGVEVFWLEWSFGWSAEGPGVYPVHVGQSTLGTFVERVPLGRTPCSPQEVIEILKDFRKTWGGVSYHLLRRNCAHFSVEFARRLRVSDAPEWINSLASVGDALVQRLGADRAEEAADAASPPEELRVAPQVARFNEGRLKEYARQGDEQAIRELVWRQSQRHILEHAAEAEATSRFLDTTLELQWGESSDHAAEGVLLGELARESDLQRALASAVATTIGRNEEESVEVLEARARPGRRAHVRLRVWGEADDDAWPPKMPSPSAFASDFCSEMRRAASSWLAADWPRGAAVLVAGVQVVSAPGHADFGLRVESASGSSGQLVFPRAASRAAAREHGTADGGRSPRHAAASAAPPGAPPRRAPPESPGQGTLERLRRLQAGHAWPAAAEAASRGGPWPAAATLQPAAAPPSGLYRQPGDAAPSAMLPHGGPAGAVLFGAPRPEPDAAPWRGARMAAGVASASGDSLARLQRLHMVLA